MSSPSTPRENFPEQHEPRSSEQQAIVRDAQWQFGVTANFSQFFQTPPSLTSPWKLVLLLKLLAGTPCGQWLELLSCERHAPGVGEQLAEDMQRDPTGCRASETLRASFGVKSPQTILKRAACLGRYFQVAYKVEERCNTGDYKPIASH